MKFRGGTSATRWRNVPLVRNQNACGYHPAEIPGSDCTFAAAVDLHEPSVVYRRDRVVGGGVLHPRRHVLGVAVGEVTEHDQLLLWRPAS